VLPTLLLFCRLFSRGVICLVGCFYGFFVDVGISVLTLLGVASDDKTMYILRDL